MLWGQLFVPTHVYTNIYTLSHSYVYVLCSHTVHTHDIHIPSYSQMIILCRFEVTIFAAYIIILSIACITILICAVIFLLNIWIQYRKYVLIQTKSVCSHIHSRIFKGSMLSSERVQSKRKQTASDRWDLKRKEYERQDKGQTQRSVLNLWHSP